jgi:hypothetical protein
MAGKRTKNAAAVRLAKMRAQKLSPERRSEIAAKGAAARADKLTAEERSLIARKAAARSVQVRRAKATAKRTNSK